MLRFLLDEASGTLRSIKKLAPKSSELEKTINCCEQNLKTGYPLPDESGNRHYSSVEKKIQICKVRGGITFDRIPPEKRKLPLSRWSPVMYLAPMWMDGKQTVGEIRELVELESGESLERFEDGYMVRANTRARVTCPKKMILLHQLSDDATPPVDVSSDQHASEIVPK